MLTGVTPHPEWIPEEPTPESTSEPTADELLDAFLGVTSYE